MSISDKISWIIIIWKIKFCQLVLWKKKTLVNNVIANVMCITYSFLQTGYIRVIRWCVFEDLPQQQRVFHQPWPRDVQEAPEVKLPAEGRLQTALQEILHPLVLLFLVQQSFGCELVTAVIFVSIQTRQLRRNSKIRKSLFMLSLMCVRAEQFSKTI